MKIRNGFVSNSSSSSFIIQKRDITTEQMDKIKNHLEYATNNFLTEFSDEGLPIEEISTFDKWDIEEKEDIIILSTIVDNFDMELFLNLIGIDEEKIIIGN